MKRFIEKADRDQSTLLPECLDDWVDAGNPVRVVDAFVDAFDLKPRGFDGIVPEVTGRPFYHPGALPKLNNLRLPHPTNWRWACPAQGRPAAPQSRCRGP
jgi:hypothetical protein